MDSDRELARASCRECVAACERVLDGAPADLELRTALILSAAICGLVAEQLDDGEAETPVGALVELAAETCADCARLADAPHPDCAEACRRAVAALRLLVSLRTS